MRESRARIAFAQGGIEIGAARDDERVDERRPLAEQAPAACADPVAQGAAAARDCIELAHPPRDQDAATEVAKKPPRDNPCRTTMSCVMIGPTNGQRAAALTGLGSSFDDAARV